MAFSLRIIGGSKFDKVNRGGTIEQQGSEVVSGVWASKGKLYISTNNSNQLTATDAVPRSRWMEKYYTLVESKLGHVQTNEIP